MHNGKEKGKVQWKKRRKEGEKGKRRLIKMGRRDKRMVERQRKNGTKAF